MNHHQRAIFLQSSASLPVNMIKADSVAKPGAIGSNEAMISLNQKMQNIRQRSNSSNLDMAPIHSDRSKTIQHISTEASPMGADDLSVAAVMQQLRDPGLLITAHGSRGKPKTVRLQLVNSAITWRTENRKKPPGMAPGIPPKIGKVHSVPLTNIMYIDAGKQTTALRRMENSSVPETLCFSLLTKEGSLDLEASSPLERDALVTSFTLVLDEIHSQNNWRDGQRALHSDMPSSFDEYDEETQN